MGAVAVALPAGLLVQALVDPAGYRHPVVPVMVWLGMLAVAAWLMPRASAGNLSNAHAAVAITVAVAAVTAIGLDRPTLSAQETRTLRLYATGLPIKSVARRLGIGEETAKQYVRRVREKYAQANRAAPTKVDLYHRAVEDGHLPSPPT